MGLLDRLIKKSGVELGDDETYRISFKIENGKVSYSVEAIPDLANMDLDKLYELQEKVQGEINELQDKEPDDESSDEYAEWEDAVSSLEDWLEEIDEQIEEVEEEGNEAYEEDDE